MGSKLIALTIAILCALPACAQANPTSQRDHIQRRLSLYEAGGQLTPAQSNRLRARLDVLAKKLSGSQARKGDGGNLSQQFASLDRQIDIEMQSRKTAAASIWNWF